MSYRDELVQVAAVAVAMLEAHDYGVAHAQALDYKYDRAVDVVLRDVRAERVRQDAKWGPQRHTPAEWLAILVEEVGELADELTEDAVPPDASFLRAAHLLNILYQTQRLGRDTRHALDNYIFPEAAWLETLLADAGLDSLEDAPSW